MPRLTRSEIEAYLVLPHVAVLSASRARRGPVAVPVWYDYADGRFWVITARASLHGRIIQQAGRATLTVNSEEYADSHSVEKYVMAEGPMAFTDDDIEPVLRRIRSRYYRGPRALEWVNRPLDPETLRQQVAVLDPAKLSGYVWEDSL